MCDVRSSVPDTPTNASENGKHRTATAIISLFKRYYDVVIVCVVIAAVWALLALPTIFYHLPMKVTLTEFLLACN